MSDDKRQYSAKGPQSEAIEAKLSVVELIRQWNACHERLADIQVRQDEMFFSKTPDAGLYRLDGERSKLKAEATHLLSAICQRRAETVEDVAAKLNFWRAARYPDGAQPKQDDCLDRVTLSAINDLNVLTGKAA